MIGIRIGHGYDVHRLTEGRPLILGGVHIPNERRLLGHSDADVLAHAVMDALLGAAALMLFWLDIRLIRYDFAQTPEMLRRLWYAYYIPMLLIPTLALYTLFFLDRGQSAPLYKYRYMIFVFPVVLFSLVLTNDCHQLAFAFPPGQEVLGSPDYTYRFVYYLCLLWIFSCAVFTVVYLVRRCRIPHTKRILWLPLVPIFFATLYALLY